MDSIITSAKGFILGDYTSLLEQAQAKGVGAAKVDEALIDAIQSGRDFAAAVKAVREQMPELAPAGVNSGNLSGWLALPSPAALCAAVILKDAAEQRSVNRSIIQAQGMQIVDLMEQQADKIESGAMQKFACAVAGSAVNMAAGMTSFCVAGAGFRKAQSSGLDTAIAKAALDHSNSMAQSFSSIVSSAGNMISAGGDYAQSLRSAEGKRLEARQEQIRTMMEQTRQTNDALKDLIARSLDFMSSMQANMNQTRTRILG